MIHKNKKIKKELETALKRVTDAESKIKDAEEKVKKEIKPESEIKPKTKTIVKYIEKDNTEKLIKKIYEKNKKIKIILIIKKENKNEINIKNKNIIKIYYDKEINLKKIKNNKNNKNNINNKNIQTKKELYKKNKKEKLNIEEKNKLKQNCKIIYFLGNTKIGKTMTIINIGRCMQDKKYKVLIISSKKISARTLTNTRDNRKRKKGKIDKKSRIKNYSKSKYIVTQKKQKIKLRKILLKKVSIKIDKNIMLLKYSKNIEIKDIENFKKIS